MLFSTDIKFLTTEIPEKESPFKSLHSSAQKKCADSDRSRNYEGVFLIISQAKKIKCTDFLQVCLWSACDLVANCAKHPADPQFRSFHRKSRKNGFFGRLENQNCRKEDFWRKNTA